MASTCMAANGESEDRSRKVSSPHFQGQSCFAGECNVRELSGIAMVGREYLANFHLRLHLRLSTYARSSVIAKRPPG